MKSELVEVDGFYTAKHDGEHRTFRVDKIRQAPSGACIYSVTDVANGKRTTFNSAAKFRKRVEGFGLKFTKSKTIEDNDPLGLGDEQRSDPMTKTGQPMKTLSGSLPTAHVTSLPSALSVKLNAKPTQAGNAPHVIVEARAGSGKTTTLIEGLKFVMGSSSSMVPSPQQDAVWREMAKSAGVARTVCMVAFNKSIAEELKRRVPPGVEAMTMHSMGAKAVTAAFGRQEPTNYAVQDIICELLGRDIRDVRTNSMTLLKATDDLVSLCKMNLVGIKPQPYTGEGTDWAEGDDELQKLANHYGVELSDERRSWRKQVFELVPKVLERCKTPKGKITFDDMIWLPIIRDLPLFRYDLLLVDECLPGWTPVMLADGRSMTIQEIVESDEEIRVRAYDTKRGVAKNCNVIAKQKILNQKPLVKIKAKHYHRTGTNRKHNFVICTIDHKIWTINRGWVEAGEIQKGDDVIIETAAKTTQKGKVTKAGREHLADLQQENKRGLGNAGGSREQFNSIKGGNGAGLSLAERTLLDALNSAWPERTWKYSFSVPTGAGHEGIYPTNYKIDIAFPDAMIGIEVDGPSHRGREEQDQKKQEFLEAQGWTIVRVPNRRAIQQTNEVVEEILVLSESVSCEGENCPRPAKVVSVDSVTIPDNYVYDITVEECHNFYANGILVHNCQDLNRCQQSLAKRAGKRLILCGDPKQAIYGFAGADAESMPRMARELGVGVLEAEAHEEGRPFGSSEAVVAARGCKILPLTVTRRCGRAIVREANQYVKEFEAHESNLEGSVSHAKYPGKRKDKEGNVTEDVTWANSYGPTVNDGDMVLCRLNAPLVNQCFAFLKAGRKANIRGRDIGKGLIATIDKMKAFTINELVGKLDDWRHKEVEKEQAMRNPSETKIQGIEDRVACLLCFCENVASVDGVKARIESIFTDDKQVVGIQLSSVHKAKGLEAKRVFLLMPDGASMPMVRKKQKNWEYEQEINILYVAVTRAVEELVYVK